MYGAFEERRRAQTLFSSPETSGFYELSGTQRALLANRGVTSGAVEAALRYLDGLTGAAQVVGVQRLGLLRVDVGMGTRDSVSLGYQWQRMVSPMTGAEVAEGVVDRALGSIGSSDVAVDAGTVRWTHRFGPRTVNEMRAQLAEDVEYEAPGAGSADVPGVGPGGLAPQVAIEPEGFFFGTPAALGRLAYPDERRVEVGETFAWRLGRHVLTIGGDWSRLDDRVLSATDTAGSFVYDSGTTDGRAGGLVDWITDYTFSAHAYPNGGCPSIVASTHYFCFRSYSQSFAQYETEFETHQIAGFAEDAVQLRPDLRVSLGVRWEYVLLPFPLTPNPLVDAALAGVTGPLAGSTASFPEDRNNVGPRVSVAWSPGRGGRRWFTVQAGYGMFFGRLPGATVDAALSETGVAEATKRIRITPTVETLCPQVTAYQQGFGYGCSFLTAPTGVAGATGSVVEFAERFRLPAVQRGTFAVERGVGRRIAVRGEYATAWATQLPETTDVNVAPSTGTASYVIQGGDGQRGMWTGQSFRVPLYTERRTALFGPVTSIGSNANATYQAGMAEVRLRDWRGWALRGSYVYSKALDYGPLLTATPRQNGQFDPFAIGYDKGISSLNRPQRFTGDVLFRSEWKGGSAWVRGVFSGWRFAATAVASSGAPYSYVIFGGTRLPGGHESINGSGGAAYLPTVGRNTLRLAARGSVNARVAREVGLGGQRHPAWRMEVRGDVFNVLNSVNVSRVETRAFLVGDAGSGGGMTPLVFQDAATVAAEGIPTPAFGTALSSTSGVSRERTVELGARVRF